MLNLLIIESNTPALVEAERAAGQLPQGDGYAAVMEGIDPRVTCTIRAPYGEGSDWFNGDDFDGVIFTGSSVDWCVNHDNAAPLQQMMFKALRSGKPVFGSCNGMQMAAHILGGSNGENPKGREDGIAQNIQKTQSGMAHPLLAGRDAVYSAPCVHRDIVTSLPAEANILAGNDVTPIQAFAYEADGMVFWGTQYHPEFSANTVSNWLGNYGYSGQIIEDLRNADKDNDAATRLGTSTDALAFEARTLELRNWLDLVQRTKAKAFMKVMS